MILSTQWEDRVVKIWRCQCFSVWSIPIHTCMPQQKIKILAQRLLPISLGNIMKIIITSNKCIK